MDSLQLEKYRDDILQQCEWTDDHHLIYKTDKPKLADRVPWINCYNRRYPWAKILYACVMGADIDSLGTLRKFCVCRLCMDPMHYVEREKLDKDGSNKDGNGWNNTMRQKLLYHIGLLHQSITIDKCIIPKQPDKYFDTRIDNGKTQKAHVVSLRLRLGRPLLPRMDASHLCHTKGCTNPLHLLEESRLDNINRSKHDNLSNKEDILAIYHDKTLSQVQLAKKYNVSAMCISNIRTGKTWSSVTQHAPKKSTYIRHEDIILTMEDRTELRHRWEKVITKIPLSQDEVNKNPELQGTEHWILPNKPIKNGYVPFSFKCALAYVHQWAAILKFELDRFPSVSNQIVRHKCLEKGCCNPDHMDLGTHTDNSRDKIRDGMKFKTRESESTIVAVEHDICEGVLSLREMAQKHNVSYTFVHFRRRRMKKMKTYQP